MPSEGRCDVIACREGSFQASEGSLPKGRCDVIACREGAFRREGVTSSRVARILPSFGREPSEGKVSRHECHVAVV
ncbi:unnamed protein product [Prunus armeniaca]